MNHSSEMISAYKTYEFVFKNYSLFNYDVVTLKTLNFKILKARFTK